MRLDPGETGLPEPSFLKAHFVSVIEMALLMDRLPRQLSEHGLREVVAMINRAIDPDAPYEPASR